MAYKRTKTLLSAAAIALGLPLFAQTESSKSNDDIEALRRWISDKRMVTLKEIGGDLSLSGEVRVEFQDTNEKKNGIRQRGPNGAVKTKAPQAWDVEVNLMLDYRTDYTWAAIKIEFDNDMGINNGTTNKIRLEKAYLGGRLVSGDTFTMDAEIGRRDLINVFDSKVEFGALFDGVLLRFNKAFESIGDYYFNGGAFLVDDRTNHYGYVGEMGMLRIANLGLGTKYSVIDWRKHFSSDVKNDRFRFVVQQFQLLYQMTPPWIGKRLVKLYAAGLTNLIAGDLVLVNGYPGGVVPTSKEAVPTGPMTNFGKQNWGWYAGVSVGQIKRKGDWAIDTNFQWMKAQAVPDFDASGIGRGNAAGVGLYTVTNTAVSPNASPAAEVYTTAQNAVGPGNYYGFEINALYAFTDNLTLNENFKWTNTLDKALGPNLTYRQFEIEFIYAF